MRILRQVVLSILLVLAVSLVAHGQTTYAPFDYHGPFVSGTSLAPLQGYLGPYFELPQVVAATGAYAGLYVKYSKGAVYVGGSRVPIAALTTGLAVSNTKTSCAAPLYSSCNIIYANSSGTVANTTSIDAARLVGNSILAYVTTASGLVTSITYPYQSTQSDTPVTPFMYESGTTTYLINYTPTARPTGTYSDYVYYLGLSDGGGSSSGLLSGGAAQKTYGFYVSLNRPSASAATGDSNDALIKLSANNYAANDTNYILRGVNVGINNRSGGTLGTLESGLYGAQAKSGGTVGTLRGLTVHPENYGTVSDEMGGIDVIFHNEAAAATLQYGIRIRNNDQSNIAAVAAALLIPANSGNTTGFTYGVDLNGAVIGTADIRLHHANMIMSGTADPNGAVTGVDGSIYLRTGTSTASTVLYVCTGGTTWTAVTVP